MRIKVLQLAWHSALAPNPIRIRYCENSATRVRAADQKREVVKRLFYLSGAYGLQRNLGSVAVVDPVVAPLENLPASVKWPLVPFGPPRIGADLGPHSQGRASHRCVP